MQLYWIQVSLFYQIKDEFNALVYTCKTQHEQT